MLRWWKRADRLSLLALIFIFWYWYPTISYAVMDGVPGSVLAQIFRHYGVRRAFPKQYIYVNTGLAAPPNRLVEVLVGPNGNDDFETNPQWYKGFTPGSAFATPQGCNDYINQTFIMNGVQPICRIMAGTYTGKIQVSGPLVGRQIDGGGSIIFWGTCGITNSPNNGRVGMSAGAADVILTSNVGETLFSLVNGAFAQVTCITAKADVYIFYAQQYSNILINSNVITNVGPSSSTVDIMRAENHGEIYASGMTVNGGATEAFANSSLSGIITFYGGASSITFSGTPTIGTTLLALDHGIINAGNASTFTGSVTGTNKCSISYESSLVDASTGASVPGSGSCTISGGTFSTER